MSDWYYKAMTELDDLLDSGEITSEEYRAMTRDIDQEYEEENWSINSDYDRGHM